jgi:hypothetical protein
LNHFAQRFYLSQALDEACQVSRGPCCLRSRSPGSGRSLVHFTLFKTAFRFVANAAGPLVSNAGASANHTAPVKPERVVAQIQVRSSGPGTPGYSTESRPADVKWFTGLVKKSPGPSELEVIDIAAVREQ